VIEGTGPGRGVPWWRSGRVLILRFAEGIGRYPVIPGQREGRVITRIRGTR
jgi:hypothetical protein